MCGHVLLMGLKLMLQPGDGYINIMAAPEQLKIDETARAVFATATDPDRVICLECADLTSPFCHSLSFLRLLATNSAEKRCMWGPHNMHMNA